MGNTSSNTNKSSTIVRQIYHGPNGQIRKIQQKILKPKSFQIRNLNQQKDILPRNQNQNYFSNKVYEPNYQNSDKTEKFVEIKSSDNNNSIKFTNNKHNRNYFNDNFNFKQNEQNSINQEFKVQPKQSRFQQNCSHKKQTELNKLIDQRQINKKQSELIQIIKNYQKKIQEAQAFGKKMKDPKKFKQFQSQALSIFIQKIKALNFSQDIQNQQGISVKFMVGRISSGKSSLINSYFQQKLEVGMGQTTMNTSLALHFEGVEIYDTPGECQRFNTKSLEVVKYLASSSQIYILYPDSLKTIQHMVRVIAAIKPNRTFLLRTQCDGFNQNSNRSLQQQITEDKKILQKWGISHLPIYATSAKKPDEFDNQKVKEMLISKPKKFEMINQ